ncbi:MAG: toxin-antitoxin system YwqK family antitoxin [Williamsia sp.]|nr:toxin-antitoxin system YwqK family antitoxin [Williamsia sp.]
MNGILYLNNLPFTGSVYSLYNKGDTAEIAGYLQGKEHGSWKQFYPNKKLKQVRRFDRGRKTGVYLAWWENGSKKLAYQFADDEYEGTCREWNSEGILIKEMNYKRGHEEGSQKGFYDNGKIKWNYVIEGGRRWGLLGSKNCVNVSDSIFKE